MLRPFLLEVVSILMKKHEHCMLAAGAEPVWNSVAVVLHLAGLCTPERPSCKMLKSAAFALKACV